MDLYDSAIVWRCVLLDKEQRYRVFIVGKKFIEYLNDWMPLVNGLM